MSAKQFVKSKSAKVKAISHSTKSEAFKVNPNIFYLIIIAYIFLLYFNTLKFNFAGDDTVLIQQNRVVQKGWSNLSDILTKGTFYGYNEQNTGAYRPLTMLTFATEIALWGNKPGLSHLVNILLYTCACILLFKVLKCFFSENNLVPILITLLFIAHPIHSEVVANIKSRDEILAFLFSFLLPCYLLFRNNESPNKLSLVIIYLSFFIGLFAKENAISFFIPILFALYFFKKESLIKIVYYFIPFGVLIIIYLLIRNSVLDNSTDDQITIYTNSVYHASGAEKIGTVFLIMFEYVKNLLFPFQLSWDYSFKQIPVAGLLNVKVIISILLHFFFLIYSIITFRKRSSISYFIIFYFATMVLYFNIFILQAQNIADRFLFVPSLAFCAILVLIAVNTLNRVNQKMKPTFIAVLLIIVLGFYSFKTYSRNQIWKNNYTFFKSGVKDSPNSYYTHQALGTFLSAEADSSYDADQKRNLSLQAIDQMEQSVKIFPYVQSNWYTLGRCAHNVGEIQKAENAYLRSINGFKGIKIESVFNLAMLYKGANNNSKALYYFKMADSLKSNFMGSNSYIGEIYLAQNDLKNAGLAFKKAYGNDSTNKYTLNNFGVMYYLLKDYNNAIHYFRLSIKSDPCFFDGLKNLGSVYNQQGKIQEAIIYFEKAVQCSPNESIYSSLITLFNEAKQYDKAKEYYVKLEAMRKK